MSAPRPSVTALAQLELRESLLENAESHLLAETDWQQWINQIELHGLSGFANLHLRNTGLPIPEELVPLLQALKQRHTAASEARYVALSELSGAMQSLAIPFLVLKGAALAPLLYKDTYLRPMRDVDILVPANQLDATAELVKELGYKMEDAHQSQYMRYMHHLPDAKKEVNGFSISLEIHHDAFPREVPGHLRFDDVIDQAQTVVWKDLSFKAMGHAHMLQHVCRHLANQQPGDFIKLINMMDAAYYAEAFFNELDWDKIRNTQPHIITTLACINYMVRLTPRVAEVVGLDGPTQRIPPQGVGDVMLPFSRIKQLPSTSAKVSELLNPSDWWLHLFYGVQPQRSLLMTKMFRHPVRVVVWLAQRIWSRVLGG